MDLCGANNDRGTIRGVVVFTPPKHLPAVQIFPTDDLLAFLHLALNHNSQHPLLHHTTSWKLPRHLHYNFQATPAWVYLRACDKKP